MAKPADVSTKRLISLAPDSWARWVTNILRIIAIANTVEELQQALN